MLSNNIKNINYHINLLKLIAVITMLLDHTFYVYNIFFDLKTNWINLTIGRLAFPLFAYTISYSFLYHTKNRILMIKKILFFAIISQPIYYLVFEHFTLNILFVFFISLTYIIILESNNLLLKISSTIFIFLLPFYIPIEYHILGILLIILFYFYHKTNMYKLPIFITVLILNSSTIFTIFIFPIIYWTKNITLKINFKHNFLYYFYPIHLLILYCILKSLN